MKAADRMLFVIIGCSMAGAIPQEAAAVTTKTQLSDSQLAQVQAKASEWKISPEEWLRYRELMEGARGYWTPDADPLLALGAHAKTDSERRRYAELYVVREYERVQGELAYQRAISAAWIRLYPNQQRIKTPPKSQERKASLLAPRQRFAVVVEPGCDECPAAIDRLVQRIARDAKQNLDIYVRKTNADDAKLRAWVDDSTVPVPLIRDRKVTINHGDQYEGAVPQVWSQSGAGEWLRVR